MAAAVDTQARWHWPLVRALPVGVLSIVAATLGSLLFPPTNWMPADVPDVAFIEALVRWDAGWYGEIAQNGYWLTPGKQSPVAFFPLYPMIIRAIAWLGVNRWVAGIAVSFCCAMAALSLFHRWARHVMPEHAGSAFWLLALYPFAEYLYGVVYSDALFLLCAVGAFLALERDKPVLSAVLGALACACRPVAPAVVVGLLARSIERRRKAGLALRFVDFVPALAGLGLVAFMAYLEVRFDDPLAFAHVQGVPGWEQPPGWRSWLKFSFFDTMFPTVAPAVAVRLGGHALVTIAALALSVPTFKRLGWGYGLYVLVVVGIPAVSSKDFQGLGRYVIAAFPLLVTVATVLGARTRSVAFACSAGVLMLCAVALGSGAYVS